MTIEAVSITNVLGDCRVMVRFENTTEFVQLFCYYADELSISEGELIGLTAGEAIALKQAKDIAYLRS